MPSLHEPKAQPVFIATALPNDRPRLLELLVRRRSLIYYEMLLDQRNCLRTPPRASYGLPTRRVRDNAEDIPHQTDRLDADERHVLARAATELKALLTSRASSYLLPPLLPRLRHQCNGESPPHVRTGQWECPNKNLGTENRRCLHRRNHVPPMVPSFLFHLHPKRRRRRRLRDGVNSRRWDSTSWESRPQYGSGLDCSRATIARRRRALARPLPLHTSARPTAG